MKTYTPSPLNAENITLPDNLTELTEAMARNVHEVWALGRVKEGWKYGETRNDELKTHPGLVPYEELPDSEREYDRQTAIQTLKLIMKADEKDQHHFITLPSLSDRNGTRTKGTRFKRYYFRTFPPGKYSGSNPYA